MFRASEANKSVWKLQTLVNIKTTEIDFARVKLKARVGKPAIPGCLK